jgi:hypothetical protein
VQRLLAAVSRNLTDAVARNISDETRFDASATPATTRAIPSRRRRSPSASPRPRQSR